MRIPIVLTVGLVLTALATGVLLSSSPFVLVSANSIAVERAVAAIRSHTTVCQAEEKLPEGTSAIRFGVGTSYGPKVTVKALEGSRVLSEGSRGGEWVGPVSIPVSALAHAHSHVSICITFGAVTESVTLTGAATPATVAATIDGKALAGRTRIEYLRRGDKSWLSLAPSIARHMGLGRASSGTWIVFLAIALMMGLVGLTSIALVRDLK